MFRLVKKTKKTVSSLALATIIGVASLQPAFAIENKSECDAAVEEANKALLKAHMSNEKVTEIFTLIDAAIAACANEAFGDAKAKLEAARAEIDAASDQ